MVFIGIQISMLLSQASDECIFDAAVIDCTYQRPVSRFELVNSESSIQIFDVLDPLLALHDVVRVNDFTKENRFFGCSS